MLAGDAARRQQLCEMRIGDRLVLFFVIEIDVVETQQLPEVDVIDDAETEQLANVRLRDAVVVGILPQSKRGKIASRASI